MRSTWYKITNGLCCREISGVHVPALINISDYMTYVTASLTTPFLLLCDKPNVVREAGEKYTRST